MELWRKRVRMCGELEGLKVTPKTAGFIQVLPSSAPLWLHVHVGNLSSSHPFSPLQKILQLVVGSATPGLVTF